MRIVYEPALYRGRVIQCWQRRTFEFSEEPSGVNEGLSSSTKSLFDALRAPPLSHLTQKRSVHCNPPPKRRARGEGASEPKSITATQRVKAMWLLQKILIPLTTHYNSRSSMNSPYLPTANRNNERIMG